MPYDTERYPLTRFTQTVAPMTDAERRSLARHGPARGKAPVAVSTTAMSLVPLRGTEPETGDDTAARPRSLIRLAGTTGAPTPDDTYPADAPLARPVPGIPTAYGVPFGAPEPAFPADAPLARLVPRVPTAFGVPFASALEPPADPAPGREGTARLMNIADAQQARARPTLAAIDGEDDQDVFAGIGGSERDLAVWHRIRDDVDSGRLTPEMIARRIGNLRRAPVGHTLADQQLLAALEIMQDRDLARREAQGLGLDPERLDRLSRMRAEGGSADDVANEIRGLVVDMLPFIGGARATAETIAAANDFRRAMEAGDRDAMLEAGLLTLIGAAAYLPGGGVIARIGRGAVKSALRSTKVAVNQRMVRKFLDQYERPISGSTIETILSDATWNSLKEHERRNLKGAAPVLFGDVAREAVQKALRDGSFGVIEKEGDFIIKSVDPEMIVAKTKSRKPDVGFTKEIDSEPTFLAKPEESEEIHFGEVKLDGGTGGPDPENWDATILENPDEFYYTKDSNAKISGKVEKFRAYYNQINEDFLLHRFRNHMKERSMKEAIIDRVLNDLKSDLEFRRKISMTDWKQAPRKMEDNILRLLNKLTEKYH